MAQAMAMERADFQALSSGAWQKYAYNRTYGIIRAKNG
jgi:hypothetical protein